MKKQWIERKPPRYSTIAYILHYAYKNDYPKNSEKFVWGIPSKYTHIKDREISAIVSSYIYDGTQKSLKAARSVDAMFDGKPFEWLASEKHCEMMMQQNQMRQIYGRITVTDLYWLFRELKTLYANYGSIYKRFSLCKLDTLQDNIECALSVLTPFCGKSVEHFSRRNLFFIMMAHCYNDYKIDESQLIVPLYGRLISTCKALGLLEKKDKLQKDTAILLTDNLRWFSEKHPTTFWIGIFGYMEALREYDNELCKLAKSPLVRHGFRKR